jgi:hypothetical protein
MRSRWGARQERLRLASSRRPFDTRDWLRRAATASCRVWLDLLRTAELIKHALWWIFGTNIVAHFLPPSLNKRAPRGNPSTVKRIWAAQPGRGRVVSATRGASHGR